MGTNDPAALTIVTGAASGMGEATARLLAGRGPILLLDRDAARLAAVAEALGGAETLVVDLASHDFPVGLIAAIGDREIGTLVHCAGLSPTMAAAGPILEVNLAASIRLVDAVRSRMAAGGAAVLFASTAGHMLGTTLDARIDVLRRAEDVAALAEIAADPGTAYAVSKRGVILLVRREAVAFGRRGARIVSVSPGIVDTPMGRVEREKQALMDDLIATSALARAADAGEVAAVAVFLASPAAGFVTGTDVLVDGGSIATMPVSVAA